MTGGFIQRQQKWVGGGVMYREGKTGLGAGDRGPEFCCGQMAVEVPVTSWSQIVCYHTARETGRLKQQTLVSLRTGGWKSKRQAPAGPVSGEGRLPGWQTVSSAHVLTW